MMTNLPKQPEKALTAGSNVQDIPGLFQKLLHKSAVAHWQNILRSTPLCSCLLCLFHF